MATTQNTGQFAKVIVTNSGKDMITKSQNGQTLKFTRVSLGDGLLADGEDPVKLTAVKNECLSCPIAKFTDLGNGQFEVQFRLSNQSVENGFWHREIGVMAQIDEGAEQLYAYTTAGNKASFIYDKTTPVDERVVNVTFVVGNAENIEVIINNSIVYATLKDLEAHAASRESHPVMVGATANAAGKQGFVPAPAAGEQNKALFGNAEYRAVVQSINDVKPDENGKVTLITGINILARRKAYTYGDSAYSPNLPSWAYLYCVQAGTTAAKEPSFADVNAMGKYITDGTVKWIVDDVRFNIPVGVPFYDAYLHPGCVKLNGATVNRSDYIRPAKIASDNNLWTDNPANEPWKYGKGDGSTTMVLPDYRDRVIQGGDMPVLLQAGLPNVQLYIGRVEYYTPNPPNVIMSNVENAKTFRDEAFASDSLAYVSISLQRGNAIYGNSTTVQPPAIRLIPQLKF